GVLQGNAKTNWLWVIVIGLVFAVIYYLVFSFMIRKFNYKTPGREDDGEETKLYTRKDVNARKENNAVSALILKGLGGSDNISDIDACATRLRVTVKNGEKVIDSALKESGASGIIRKGNGVQVVYGPRVSVIKSNLMSYMENVSEPSGESHTIASPMNGKTVKLEDVPDEAFSGKVLGDGIAIEPSEGKLYSPFDGKVEMVFDTKHAINLMSDDGCELLMHIGIDTVSLKGKYFKTHVSSGDRVKKGDLLISFDIDGIKKEGFKTVTPIVVCNHEDYKGVKVVVSGNVRMGDKLIEIMR
ncbi:MAG: PTS glucose transporter subunit IIA, partial [Clostridia bacterium]|nr:PTS glucose transporter subunit IIA [Clostridia bacterium]